MQEIHVGIGGWNFPPWRGVFYPPTVTQAQELAYASRQVTSIEINATFYGPQKPESFRKWRDQTPDGFVFALKGPRFTTHRRALEETSESVLRFLGTGITELGDKLGPILWQFPPTRRFEPAALRPFLEALPPTHAGLPLRHAIEARHSSFADAAWMALLHEHGVAHAIVESDKHTLLADVTAPFIYVRLERNAAEEAEGYAGGALDAWAGRLQRWAAGREVPDPPCAGSAPANARRECFVYFIGGDKVRAPDAARAMLRRLGRV